MQFSIFGEEVPIRRYCANNYMSLAMSCCHLQKWSVITLNYDEALDWAFRILLRTSLKPEPVQYLRWMDIVESGGILEESYGGVYVKPHGSLGLFECLNPRCDYYRKPIRPNPNDRRLLLARRAIERVTIGYGTAKCPGCGVDTSPLLLPPGKNKSPEEKTFLDAVFAVAQRALEKADNWVLVGYSFPHYDADVRNLMKHAARSRERADKAAPKVWVIAPDAVAIAERVSESANVRGIPIAATFSDFAEGTWRAMGIELPVEGVPM